MSEDKKTNFEDLWKQAEEAEKKAKELREQAEEAKRKEEADLVRKMHTDEPAADANQREVLNVIPDKNSKTEDDAKNAETEHKAQTEQPNAEESQEASAKPDTTAEVKDEGNKQENKSEQPVKESRKVTVETGTMVAVILASACLGAFAWACGYSNGSKVQTRTAEPSSVTASEDAGTGSNKTTESDEEAQYDDAYYNDFENGQDEEHFNSTAQWLSELYKDTVVPISYDDMFDGQTFCTGVVTGSDDNFYYIAVPLDAAAGNYVYVWDDSDYTEAQVVYSDETNQIAIVRLDGNTGSQMELSPLESDIIADGTEGQSIYTIYMADKTQVVEQASISGVGTTPDTAANSDNSSDLVLDAIGGADAYKVGGLMVNANGNAIAMMNTAQEADGDVSYNAVGCDALIDDTLNVETGAFTITDNNASSQEEDEQTLDDQNVSEADEENTNHGYLGVVLQNKDADDNSVYGAYVVGVAQDSEAYAKGLREGDIITSINQQAVTTANDAVEIVENLQSGDEVEITYLTKDGKYYDTHTVYVTLSGSDILSDLSAITEQLNRQ